MFTDEEDIHMQYLLKWRNDNYPTFVAKGNSDRTIRRKKLFQRKFMQQVVDDKLPSVSMFFSKAPKSIDKLIDDDLVNDIEDDNGTDADIDDDVAKILKIKIIFSVESITRNFKLATLVKVGHGDATKNAIKEKKYTVVITLVNSVCSLLVC